MAAEARRQHATDVNIDRFPPEGASMAVVIFTDLDASLLDHEGYGFSGAAAALEQIRHRCIPLIAVTSKCRPEVEAIQAQLGICEPFVVENGAAICVPRGCRRLPFDGDAAEKGATIRQWGIPYRRIRSAFAEARRCFPVIGFGDMDAAEVSRRTGLPLDRAILARRREFSEPFVLQDPDRLDALASWAADRGLAIVRGGRFLHLIAADQSKGRAVTHLIGLFRETLDNPLVTIGIGDSPNDASMLAAVDIPVIIARDDDSAPELNIAGAILAPAPGSRGWNRAVLDLLQTLNGKPAAH